MKKFLSQFIAYVSIFAVVLQPIVASAGSITIDGSAPRANQAGLSSSGGGKPVVNIVKPNAGVSHNRFTTLNTSSGVIFNNSKSAGTSRTGGSVAGNANFGSGPTAKVILNEVRGGATSLRGSNEIFGSKADLIIANESGVTCNGCTFVNTGRATLSTGKPEIANGVVTMNVQRGTVTVGRGGASGADRINLSGRRVKVDGPVTSGWIDAVGGAHKYNTGTGGVTIQTPSAADTSSYVAVDATRYGAMTAGHIRLIGTEAGLGVRSIGRLKTTVGSAVLKSEGSIEYKDVVTTKNLHVTAKQRAHQRQGTVTVGQNAYFNVKDYTQNPKARMKVGGTLDINATGLVAVAGEVVANAVDADVTARFVNLGEVIASGEIKVVAGEIYNRRPTETDYILAPDAPEDSFFVGWVAYDPIITQANSAHSWDDSQGNLVAGGVLAAQDLRLTSRTADIQNSGVMLAAGSVLIDAKKQFYQRSRRAVHRTADYSIYKKTNLALVEDARTRTLLADTLPSGVLNRYDNIRDPLISGGRVYYGAKTHAWGDVTIEAGTHLYNFGGKIASDNGHVSMDTVYDTHLKQYGRWSQNFSDRGNLSVKSGRHIYFDNGHVMARQGTLSLHAGHTLSMDAESPSPMRFTNLSLQSLGAGYTNNLAMDTSGWVSIVAQGTLTNNQTIKTGKSLALESRGGEIRNNAELTPTGNLWITSHGHLYTNRIVSGGNINLRSKHGSVVLQGEMRGNGGTTKITSDRVNVHLDNRFVWGRSGVNVTAGANIYGTGVRVRSNGDIALLAGRYQGGSIAFSKNAGLAYDNGYVRATGSTGAITIDTDRGSVTANALDITAPGRIALESSYDTRIQNSTVTGGSIFMAATGRWLLNEQGSRLEATLGEIRFNGRDNYNRASTAKAATDIYVRGNIFYNESGIIEAGRHLNVVTTNQIRSEKNYGGLPKMTVGRNTILKSNNSYLVMIDTPLTSNGSVTLDAKANQVIRRSSISAAGAAVFKAGSTFELEEASWILAKGITANTGGFFVLRKGGAKIEATVDPISITTGNVFYNRDSLVKSPSDITIVSKGFENDGARIIAGGNFTSTSAGNWRSVDAYGKTSEIRSSKVAKVKTSAGYIWNRNATISGRSGVLLSSAANTHNDRSTVVSGYGNATLSAGTNEWRQTGGLLKARAITINSGHHLYQFGNGAWEATTGDINLSAVHDYYLMDGSITTPGNLTLTDSRNIYFRDSVQDIGGTLNWTTRGVVQHRIWDTRRARSTVGGDITITAGNYFQNYRGDIATPGNVTVTNTAGYSDNYGGTISGYDVTLKSYGRVYNRNHTGSGRIKAARNLILQSTHDSVELSDSYLSAGYWLKLLNKTTPSIHAGGAAKAQYKHLGVYVYGGAFNNPFTVNTVGAVDLYASGDLTNTKRIEADTWLRLRSAGGKLTHTSQAISDNGWVLLTAKNDLKTDYVRAKKDLNVESFAGSVINTRYMRSVGAMRVAAHNDIINAARIATDRNTVSSAVGMVLTAGRHVDLTNTRVEASGKTEIASGQRVAGNLTLKTTTKAKRAEIHVAGSGNDLYLRAQAGGSILVQGGWIGAADLASVYSGSTVATEGSNATGGYIGTRFGGARVSINGSTVALKDTSVAISNDLTVHARGSGGLTWDGGIEIEARNIGFLSPNTSVTSKVFGLDRIVAADLLRLEGGHILDLKAATITAKRFDFANTKSSILRGSVRDSDSSDLILTAARSLTLSGTTQRRDISLTSQTATVRNDGTLRATRTLSLVSQATGNGSDVWNRAVRVMNTGRLIGDQNVVLTAVGSVQSSYTRGDDITITSSDGNINMTGSVIADEVLTLNAKRNITTRSAFADVMDVRARFGSFSVVGWTASDTSNFRTGRNEFANRMSSRIGTVGTEDAGTTESEVIVENDVNTAFRNSLSALFHSAGDLTLDVRYDVKALDGAMISGEGDVSITTGRDLIVRSSTSPQTRGVEATRWVTSFDCGGDQSFCYEQETYIQQVQADDRLNRSGILSDGVLVLDIGRNLTNHAGTFSSKSDMFVTVGQNLLNNGIKTNYVLTAEHDCEGNACGRFGFVHTPGEFLSGRGIVMSAGGSITNSASQIASAGSLSIHAGGNILNESQQGQYRIVDVYEKKKFLFITTSVLVKVVHKVEIGSAVIQTEYGDIHLTSDTGHVKNIGSFVSSGGDLTIDADKDIVLNAVSEEAENVYKKRGFQGLGYSSNKTYWNNFGTALSMLEAGGSIDLTAGRDIAGIGVSIMALDDVRMSADRDILYDAKQNEKYKIDKGWSIGFTSGGFPIATSLLDRGTRGALQAYMNDNPAIAAVHKLATAEDGWGTVNGTLALIWHGADVLASANSVFRQIGGQTSMSSALAQQFIPTDYQTFASLGQACADGLLSDSCAAAVGIGFRFDMWETRQEWTETYISQIGAGRDLTISAARDVVLAGGSVVSAAGDVTVIGGRDVLLAAVADNTHTTSRSWGLSVSLSGAGLTIGGHAEGSDAVQTIFSNAVLTAGEGVYLTSGQDTSLMGARVTATDIYMTVGRDLRVASRQNTSESSQWGFNASLTIGPNGPTGFSVGGNYGQGTRAFTDTPTWIEASAINDIYVGRATYLMGAVLSSESGQLTLDTGAFIFDNYDDHDLSWSVSGSVGLSGDFQNLSGNFNASYSNVEGLTFATVAGGTVRVRDNPGINLNELNTDINNVSRITEETYFAIEIPGINLAELRENLEESGNFLRALTADVPDHVRAAGSGAARIYRRMIANGMSAEQANASSRTQAFREAVLMANNVAVLRERYGNLSDVPENELIAMMFAEGTLYDVDGELYISVNCDLAGRCEVLAAELADYYRGHLQQIQNGLAIRDSSLGRKFRDFLVACAEEDPNFILAFREEWGQTAFDYLLTMSSGRQADIRANNTYSNILGYDPAILNAALDRFAETGATAELRLGMVEAAIQFYEDYGYFPADPESMEYISGTEGIMLVLGFVPIVGTAIAGYQFYVDYQSGNIIGASVNGVAIVASMIPVGGGVIRILLRGSDEAIDIGGDAGQALVRGLDEVTDVGQSFFTAGGTVGSRSALRANLIARYPELAMDGWQAHHIIPWNLRSHPLLQRLGVNLNDIGNGMPLGTSVVGACSATHCGSHANYNDAVEIFLDTLEGRNLPDNITQQFLVDAMDTLRGNLNSGTPLRNVDGATVDMWLGVLGVARP